MTEKGDTPKTAADEKTLKGTIVQMRGLSLSDSDLSNARDDLDQQLAYNYMVLQMTSNVVRTDELLYSYINNFARFSGVELPPYLIKALHEVSSIAQETDSSTFATFMAETNKKMAKKKVRQDPMRFYKHLGKNFCHIGTMLRTMAIMLAHGQTQDPSSNPGNDEEKLSDDDTSCPKRENTEAKSSTDSKA